MRLHESSADGHQFHSPFSVRFANILYVLAKCQLVKVRRRCWNTGRNGSIGMHEVTKRNLKLTRLGGSTSSLSGTFQGRNMLDARHPETTAVVISGVTWLHRDGSTTRAVGNDLILISRMFPWRRFDSVNDRGSRQLSYIAEMTLMVIFLAKGTLVQCEIGCTSNRL